MSSKGALGEWATKSISSLLQLPPDQCDEIVSNILAYDDPSELKDFLGCFAETGSEHRISSFVKELFERKNPKAQGKGSAPGASEPEERQSGGKGKDRGKGKGKNGRSDDSESRRRAQDSFPKMLMPTRPKDKDDKRLMVIDAASGRHNILTNCINCGKVIAEEEGWGPCLFCGNALEVGDAYGVRSGDDRGFLEDASISAAEQDKFNASFETAKATKDRLLSYDRDAKKRTKVFDDATDWYTEKDNPWLDQRQRDEAARRGAEEDRKTREEKRKIHATIDLFGRTVVDATAQVEKERNKKNKDSYEAYQDKVEDENKLRSMYGNEKGLMDGHGQLSGASQTLYDSLQSKLRASLHESGKKFQKDESSAFGYTAPGDSKKKNPRWDASIDDNRIENDFTDVSTAMFAGSGNVDGPQLLAVEESPYGDDDDKGMCISMHQPWATLLVHGFKRAEGRAWKHEHRGRLWIHAAAKPVDAGQIEWLEDQYRDLYENRGIPIPKMPSEFGGYPTSALLGCVDMEACWSKEEYAGVLESTPSMPPEDNDCDFIFWCLRPRRLIVPLKMGGDNKIWRLPVPSTKAAQRGLQPVRWPAATGGENPMGSPAIARRQPVSGRGARDASPDVIEEEEQESVAHAASSGSAVKTTAAAAKGAPSAATAKGVQRARVPPLLDLWPAVAAEERLEVILKGQDKADRDVVILQDGFVQLVGFVPPDIQQRLIDEMREIGVSDRGFFAEKFDGIKVSTDVSRMCLGMHWNAQAQRWDTSRSNLDGQPAAPIPKFLIDMYDEAVKRANRELARNKKRKYIPFPEGKAPSLAVVNFFQASGTMQIHQDRTESKEAIAAGYPVMGICIGDSCDLPYGTEQPTSKHAPKSLRLESGDVYLFGSASRMLWHGVSRVIPRSAPPSLRLVPGRLSVTLRVH